MVDQSLIRNFSIIAHIDHGKSTLADRILEKVGLLKPGHESQVLDNLDVEREHGITVKAQAVSFEYTARDGRTYTLNLIDTPGHVDFSYEVSRSLAACEGALLLVDASQGVQAQTVANFYIALDEGLEIIPVINKIDLPVADVEGTKLQIEEELGLPSDDALLVSAKEGIGIDELLNAIVERIPPPKGNPDSPLKALVFDSYYDPYKGVVVKVKIVDGKVRAGDRILFMRRGSEYTVEEVGYLKLNLEKTDELTAGEVGYLTASIKSISEFGVGDTITHADNPADEPISGYREPKPMVYAGIFPSDTETFERLKEALMKLKLNDAALTFEPTTSNAMGMGFRCGFLGLLHLEIVRERLEKEQGVSVITTVPNVRYKVILTNGEEKFVDNPAEFPEPSKIKEIHEPYVSASVMTPPEYLGTIMQLLQERRGEQKSIHYYSDRMVEMMYEVPLAEIIYDFFDALKSASRGYASLDYELIDYRKSDVVKLDILVNGKPVDALAQLVHRTEAHRKGREIVQKLRKLIPKHLFPIAIQAAVGSKVVARADISPLRKDVTAKCYGGDITRKRKLLEKQKEGKKRMKTIGSVSIPQEAFIEVVKRN